MNLHWIDWSIVGLLIVGLTVLTLKTRKYVRSVADFLAANRVAGRYLLTVAQGIGGAIAMIAAWEMTYSAGLPPIWWGLMGIPVGLLMSLTGFISYRFRQTRALTLAQFFEMRYSRRFRFFAGLLCWISGVINYGIFPAVTARFMIYFFGLPDYWNLGFCHLPIFPLMMALNLSFALFIALSGGQITIMITDFVEGIFSLIIAAVLMVFIVLHFSWADVVAGLQMAPAGKSMINPFDTGRVPDFNLGYFLIGMFAGIYNHGSWQGSSGYKSAAKTPHEAKMAGILGGWRGQAKALAMLLIPLAAYAVLHHPKFAALAAPITADISRIADPHVQGQMHVPLFLSHLLPVGLLGAFAAIIVCSAISCDDTYLHAWGSIFVQDVILPYRKKPMDPKTHLLFLRLSIAAVAAFGFVFSLFFQLKDYIYMWFAVTSAIYMGGAGAVIIGGLYWKRGTTYAAWVAMILGSSLAFGGILLQQTWTPYLVPVLGKWFPHSAWLAAHATKFPINGQLIYFIAMLSACFSYVLVSLLGPRQVHNMDKLLHRGAYAVASDEVRAKDARRRTWTQIIGLTGEFTRRERWLFWVTFSWSMCWWGVFLGGTAWNLLASAKDTGWSAFWWFKIWLGFGLGIVTTVWFLVGGLRDATVLMRDLRSLRRDTHDDGTVAAGGTTGQTNAEVALVEKTGARTPA